MYRRNVRKRLSKKFVLWCNPFVGAVVLWAYTRVKIGIPIINHNKLALEHKNFVSFSLDRLESRLKMEEAQSERAICFFNLVGGY